MFNNRFPLSIWDEFDRLEREMDRLAGAFGDLGAPEPDFPAMNVWVNDDEALVTAQLPGVEPGNLELSVVGESLTISSERKPEKVSSGGKLHRQERAMGRFTRSIELPFPIQAERVEASLQKGVLHVRAPRAEADKPKRISVRTS